MKKAYLIMMFAGMMAVSVQAQYFAGGSLGVDFKESSSSWGTSTSSGPSSLAFDVSPMVGYYLSDKLGAGVKISLGMSMDNDRRDDPTKYREFEWGFGPFLRYSVLTRGDFSVLIEGGVGVFGSSSKEISGTITDKGPSTIGVELSVGPLLSYSLTSRVNLEASSNLARFGFSTQTRKYGTGDSQSKSSSSSFGFGVDSNDFFSSPYRIGMIFKF